MPSCSGDQCTRIRRIGPDSPCTKVAWLATATLYTPLWARGQYVSQESKGLLDTRSAVVAPLVAHFSEPRKLSKKDVAELRKLLRGPTMNNELAANNWMGHGWRCWTVIECASCPGDFASPGILASLPGRAST